MDAMREIEGLVSFEQRAPGTDSERRAAIHLARRLEALGREARIEPISVFPNWAVTHLLHALLGIGASVLSVGTPAVGFGLALAAALSAFGDLTGTFFLVRRLTGRRASQNVTSVDGSGRPGTLILVAYYDAGRGGALFSPRALERRAALGELLRRPVGPFQVLFWSIVLILACAALRLAGLEGLVLTIVQFIPTVALIASVPLLGDAAVSEISPGANHNASGAATALRLAERYGGRLEHFDLWVLFTGAENGLSVGMREWLKIHARELDRESTVFLGIEGVGRGEVRYLTDEGPVLGLRYHPTLVELCDEIAFEEENREPRAWPLGERLPSDAHRARLRGYPAIRVCCAWPGGFPPDLNQPSDTPERIDRGALDRTYGFCSELVELLDERVGPELDRLAYEPEAAA